MPEGHSNTSDFQDFYFCLQWSFFLPCTLLFLLIFGACFTLFVSWLSKTDILALPVASDVDFQGQVWWVWSIHCPQEVLLSFISAWIVSYIFHVVGVFVSCVKWTQSLFDVWKCWRWGSLKERVLWSLMYYISLSFVVTCDACWCPCYWDDGPLDWWWEENWCLVPSFPCIFQPCCLIGCL